MLYCYFEKGDLMNANRTAKVSQVKEIVEKINASESIVIAEYAGLTVKETQELRNNLREAGVELKVYKNRLFKIAAKEAGFDDLTTDLVGPNAFAFGMEDGISPAKVLAKFAKENDALKLKMGTYEGKVIDAEEVMQIAKLPSYDEALTMLAMSMLSPIKFVGSGLHMLATEGHLEGDAEEAKPTEEPKEEAATEEVTPTEETEVKAEEAAPVEETKEEAAPAAEAEVEVKEETEENKTAEEAEEAKGE